MPPQPVATEPTPSPETRAAQLARGQYLAQITGCTTCHGKDLSGDKMPNITPDPESGIGGWADNQIIAAIRQGVRPDGARLASIMPYPYFNRMTDADAQALVVFLRAQAPVQKHVARAEYPQMPPIAMSAPTGNVDRVEDPRAHGEYLAQLMHCGGCHTPRQGPYANQALAGSGKMPNITPDRDTGIGSWNDDDIVRAVREMKDPTGRDLDKPMALYKDGWSHLADADALALVTFLRSVPAVHHDISTDAPPAVSQRP